MQVKVEKTDKNSEVKLEFTVEAKTFTDAMQKIFNQNAKYFSIPGFRKGKAPMNIVEKFYGAEIFYEDAFNDVFEKVYPEAIKENKLEVMTRPDVDIKTMEKGKDLEFTVTVGVKPEVKLGKYKGLEIEKVEYKVTDEDVENELKQVQEKNSRLVSVDNRAVKSGDTTTIDFEGFVDEKAFEGGKAENHELVIGSNTFIPGFEDQIIGMKIDEEKDVKVKFPDDYFSKDLAGKDAVFKVKLHEIKEKELPKLDDEFAKDVSEFDTLNEYKANIKFKKEEQADERAKNQMQEEVVNKACEVSEVDISDAMVELELDNMLQDMDRRLSYQGFKMDQYLKMIGKTVADFRNENREVAKNSIKIRLVLDAICNDSKIEADEKEINDKIQELAKTYGRKEEDLKANEELMENIEGTIKNDKAIKLLLDNAKFASKKSEKAKDDKKEESKSENKKTEKKSTKAENSDEKPKKASSKK